MWMKLTNYYITKLRVKWVVSFLHYNHIYELRFSISRKKNPHDFHVYETIVNYIGVLKKYYFGSKHLLVTTQLICFIVWALVKSHVHVKGSLSPIVFCPTLCESSKCYCNLWPQLCFHIMMAALISCASCLVTLFLTNYWSLFFCLFECSEKWELRLIFPRFHVGFSKKWSFYLFFYWIQIFLKLAWLGVVHPFKTYSKVKQKVGFGKTSNQRQIKNKTIYRNEVWITLKWFP